MAVNKEKRTGNLKKKEKIKKTARKEVDGNERRRMRNLKMKESK